MKRPREATLPSLGATELAAALNSGDANKAYRYLQRFTKVVRHQRRLALQVDSDEKDGSENDVSEDEVDENDDTSLTRTQKFRKAEAWKEDTAGFAVPFVGTSTSRGDAGRVVVGKWPTGLLEAYLRKSPSAVELTSETFVPNKGEMQAGLQTKKDRKLSVALYKAHLQALAELATAGIPLLILRAIEIGDLTDYDGGDVETEAGSALYLNQVMKHAVSVCNLVQLECKGRDNETVECSPYVPVGLRLLYHLVLTTRRNRQYIVEYIASSGMWRYLFKPQAKPDRIRQQSRELGFQLLIAFLSLADPVVIDMVASAGVYGESFRAPGCLYVALQLGIVESPDNDKSVTNLLKVINRKMETSNLWLRLFSRDAVINLIALTLRHAPKLDLIDNTYSHVLQGSDEVPRDLDASWSVAGVYARRILFRLLCDSAHSPFLHHMSSGKAVNIVEDGLGRMLCGILGAPYGLAMQQFALSCVQKTPRLMPCMFRLMEMPDTKLVYDTVVIFNFVAICLRDGPAPEACRRSGQNWHNMEENYIVECLWPIALMRHHVSKGLQSTSSLLVCESLKLLVRIVERAFAAIAGLKSANAVAMSESIHDRLMGTLPDIHLLLSTIARYGGAKSDDNSAVVIYAYKYLMTIFSHYPSYITEARYDWSKLMRSAESFCALSVFQQRMLLELLGAIFDGGKVSNAKSVRCACSITLH
jgi:hypothetical protein